MMYHIDDEKLAKVTAIMNRDTDPAVTEDLVRTEICADWNEGAEHLESRGESFVTVTNGICYGCDLVLNLTNHTAAMHRPGGQGPCGWFHHIAWERGISMARSLGVNPVGQ